MRQADLAERHLLVVPMGTQWQIVGLINGADAMVGQVEYEWGLKLGSADGTTVAGALLEEAGC